MHACSHLTGISILCSASTLRVVRSGPTHMHPGVEGTPRGSPRTGTEGVRGQSRQKSAVESGFACTDTDARCMQGKNERPHSGGQSTLM